MSSRKRMRFECDKSAVAEALQPSATMNDLPTDLMKNIFSFVGEGNYCFVGPVSKDFCYNYLTFDLIDDKFDHKLDYIQAIGRNKVTTIEAALSSMELAEHCFLYAPDKFQKELFRIAARNGRQDILEMAIQISGEDVNGLINTKDVMEISKKGDLDMLLFLKEKGLDISIHRYHIVKRAALHGHLDILRCLHQMKEKIPSYELFRYAAEGGHLNIIKWGIHAGYACNKASCINNAVTSGNLELVKWFRSQSTPWDTNTNYFGVESGNMELLQYLLDNGCVFESDAYECIAQEDKERKQLEVYKWLHQNNVPWDEEDTCSDIASKGNLDALIYARTHGCPWNQWVIYSAVGNADFEMVKYCLENDCPIGDNDLCCESLCNSDVDYEKSLKVLKLLRKFNIPWNEKTCESAAQFGNIEALKWARNEGCPWDERTFGIAIKFNEMKIVQYCIDNGCPSSQGLYQSAVRCEDPIPMLKLLHCNEYEWDERACTEAAIKDKLKVLRWLRYHNCPWDEGVCNEAVKNDHYDILVYAHENKCPWTKETYAYCFDEDGLDGEYGEVPTRHQCSDEIIEYLREHNCPQPQLSDWILY
ncbi:hypothetical protein CTEN210_09666 [Chaetoceros tenuissimus]|uniref:Uncharacterized protein n=1 Tax=Chaetoceros tenuissimus TaxID=426638 RepID=A0AAD3CY83_9STRA|nr:hypothetical protein CTEN210_09666 [Chaetoceros tenuissimus]